MDRPGTEQIAARGYLARESLHGLSGVMEDGEIMGLDEMGRVVAWNASAGEPFFTGETLGDVNMSQIGVLERERLARDASVLEIAGAAPHAAPGGP